MSGEAAADSAARLRLPATSQGRYAAAALACSPAGLLVLLPGVAAPLRVVLLAVLVGVGLGCAVLTWVASPGITRPLLIPALGLAAVIVVSGAAATVGWWSPRGILLILTLSALWSTAPHLPALARDMVRP